MKVGALTQKQRQSRDGKNSPVTPFACDGPARWLHVRLPIPILLTGLVARASHPDRNPHTTVPNKAPTQAVSAIASAPKM